MASNNPSSPVIDATPSGSAPLMGGSPSAAAAAVSVPPTAASEPSASAAASSPPPVDTFTGPVRDEVAFAKAAASAAASAAQAPKASDTAAEGASAGEDEEEEAGSNRGAASNLTHNWVGSAVEEGELESMAADGVLPPASSTSPAWRSALDDPYPTPVRDERVLLSSDRKSVV